jgi:hypothetical protein
METIGVGTVVLAGETTLVSDGITGDGIIITETTGDGIIGVILIITTIEYTPIMQAEEDRITQIL